MQIKALIWILIYFLIPYAIGMYMKPFGVISVLSVVVPYLIIVGYIYKKILS